MKSDGGMGMDKEGGVRSTKPEMHRALSSSLSSVIHSINEVVSTKNC